jgi:hypothetical protein
MSAEILASLIKGFPRTTTTTKQNVDPAVYYVYSRVKNIIPDFKRHDTFHAQINSLNQLVILPVKNIQVSSIVALSHIFRV